MWKDPFTFQAPLYWVGRIDYTRVDFSYADSPGEVKQIFLGLLQDECSGHEILIVLQVAAMRMSRDRPRSPHILDLMIAKGADVNICSLIGFHPLNTLLNCKSRRSGWLIGDPHRQFYLDFLLDSGARPDPERCTITPLQSTILDAPWELPSSDCVLEDVSRRIRTILNRGAAPNRVAHDETNVKRIHHACKLFFKTYEEHSFVWRNESEYIESALRGRGTSAFYDTPLRMVRNRRNRIAKPDSPFPVPRRILERLDTLENLLISYGAKSLHLFPVEGLPGYIEEDMEEWRNFKKPSHRIFIFTVNVCKGARCATRTGSPPVERTIR